MCSLVAVTLALDAEPVRVTSDDIRDFRLYLEDKQDQDVDEEYDEAQRVFPTGAAVENDLSVLREFFPRRGPLPMVLVRSQLERDGLDPDALEAVTLFAAPNLSMSTEVMLVLRLPGPEVVGLYRGLYGR